jgi:transporter family-2 protein
MIAPLLILFAVGAVIAIQAIVNSALGKSLGLPTFSVVFTIIQLLCAMPWYLASGKAIRLDTLAQVPVWQYLGAMLGVVGLLGLAHGTAKVGAFAAMITLVAGQLLMALFVDHYGWFGAAVQSISVWRVIGFTLVLVGLALVRL